MMEDLQRYDSDAPAMTQLVASTVVLTFVIAWSVYGDLREKCKPVWARFAVVSAGLAFALGFWGLVAWIWYDIRGLVILG
jgi:hypothetical protein